MKIKLSKSQWETVGRKAGWIKESQEYLGNCDGLAKEINSVKFLGNQSQMLSQLNLEKYPVEFLISLVEKVNSPNIKEIIRSIIIRK